jgi:TonB family protein
MKVLAYWAFPQRDRTSPAEAGSEEKASFRSGEPLRHPKPTASEYSIQMAASPQAHERDERRRGLRYRVQAPLDVTVLRSGIPDTVPGRLVNLGAGGVAAVLASELLPGEAVGIEIRLPQARTEDALRARALVRHHDRLRCGMEFVGLSAQQQAALREWTEAAKPEEEKKAEARPRVDAAIPVEDPKTKEETQEATRVPKGGGSGGAQPPARKVRGREWIFLLLSVATLLAVLWWRWNRAWEDLESGLPKNETIAQPQTRVPAEAMEKLVRHRVDPDYPIAARPGKMRGVIVLDVVVGRDGKVVDVYALNGPEILAQAATDAMRWWRFEPYEVNGQPAVVETTVAMEFKP